MSPVPGSATFLSHFSPTHLHSLLFCDMVRSKGGFRMKKQKNTDPAPEELELTLTMEPEEEEQPEPGDGSALTDDEILLFGYLGSHLGSKK
jgi:hypothetical protein